MRRYSILGVRHGEECESEIAQCDSSPDAVADAARQQVVMLDVGKSQRESSPKWRGVRVRDNTSSAAVEERWPDGNG